MQPDQQQPAPQPAAPDQGGGDAAMKAMMQVRDVLGKLQEIAPKGFPPEAQKLLSQASQAYDGFLQMILGGQGGQQPAAPQDPNAAGKKAVPADQAMRPASAQPA